MDGGPSRPSNANGARACAISSGGQSPHPATSPPSDGAPQRWHHGGASARSPRASLAERPRRRAAARAAGREDDVEGRDNIGRRYGRGATAPGRSDDPGVRPRRWDAVRQVDLDRSIGPASEDREPRLALRGWIGHDGATLRLVVEALVDLRQHHVVGGERETDAGGRLVGHTHTVGGTFHLLDRHGRRRLRSCARPMPSPAASSRVATRRRTGRRGAPPRVAVDRDVELEAVPPGARSSSGTSNGTNRSRCGATSRVTGSTPIGWPCRPASSATRAASMRT